MTMFEGDSADMCVNEGPSGGSCVRRPGSEDPHRPWRKLLIFLYLIQKCFDIKMSIMPIFVIHPLTL
jgi:hypothetical protein